MSVRQYVPLEDKGQSDGKFYIGNSYQHVYISSITNDPVNSKLEIN